jgi:phospholipid/cholesterol/gamma-HCH transport system substrate-binding protein
MLGRRKQIKWASLKVGILVTVALLIVFFAVLFAGNIQNIFSPKIVIYSTFDNVKGLGRGAPVLVSGIEVGHVETIRFSSAQKVRVGLAIEQKALQYIKEDSKANILTLGLLGDKYVEIIPGSMDSPPLLAGGAIPGQQELELKDVISTTDSSIKDLDEFINLLKSEFENSDGEGGTLPMLLKDPELYENLKIISRSLVVFAKKLEGEEGTVQMLLNSKEMYENLRSASESLDAFTQSLAESRGTVNRLIKDDELYENFNGTSEKVLNLLTMIENGQGVLGDLMYDDELTEEIKSTISEINTLIKAIKEKPKKYFKFSIF